MNKKAITPLIATVLLIGLTVVIATIALIWGSDFLKGTIEDVDVTTGVTLACIDVKFDIADVDCRQNFGVSPYGYLQNVSLINQGEQEISGWVFRVTKSGGTATVTTETLGLGSFEAGKITYGFGFEPNFWPHLIEVIAQITQDGVTFDCTAGIEEYNIANGLNTLCTCSDGDLDPGEVCETGQTMGIINSCADITDPANAGDYCIKCEKIEYCDGSGF